MEGAKVVSLWNDVNFRNGEPDEDLIEALEALLSDARSGYLRAIAYASVRADRSLATSWRGHADQHDMTAAIAKLDYRFLRATTEDDE